MAFDLSDLYNVNRESVLTPAMIAIWDALSIGVAVVDAGGFCQYMNPIQRRIDGFNRIEVVGRHITSLYVPHELECIPTMECLNKGEPLVKKVYWYKTTNNYLASTATDFFPLFDNNQKDGCIAFTIWLGATMMAGGDKKAVKPGPRSGKEYGLYTFDDLVGGDDSVLGVINEARTAAKTSSPVIIWGESGTGKEVFAQAIHSASERRERPFIPVNCAAIPENLLEGILFGTTRGAYTDAADKAGLFEEANGGTLLLDELNSMPLGLQAKLLRVLQEKRVRRLGSHKENAVDVRIISILNEPPLQAVERGILRRDLFYRLAVVGLEVPPLRERRKDIPLLARTFVGRSELRPGSKFVEIAEDVIEMFFTYDWPGNIRELAHVIEASLALLDGLTCIEKGCLPHHFREAYKKRILAGKAAPSAQAEGLPAQRWGASAEERDVFSPARSVAFFDYSDVRRDEVVPLKSRLNEYESRCIINVLRVTGGNVAKAARMLGMTPAGLRYRIRILGIEEDAY